MTTTPHSEDALLAMLRQHLEPEPGAHQRVLTALGAKLGLETPTPPQTPAVPSQSKLAPSRFWSKLTGWPNPTRALLATAVVSFSAGYWLGQGPQAQAPGTVSLPVASSLASLPVNASSVDHDAPMNRESPHEQDSRARIPSGNLMEARGPVSGPAPTHAPTPRESETSRAVSGPAKTIVPLSGDAFAQELALFERVERALRRRDTRSATSLLGELDTLFPQGRLQQERQAASVMLHCQDAVNAQNRRAAERFLETHPGSVYAPRVRAQCALDGQAP